MTATATAEPTAPSLAPLRPRPDQTERWIAHVHPLPFEEAAQLVLDAHTEDGERCHDNLARLEPEGNVRQEQRQPDSNQRDGRRRVDDEVHGKRCRRLARGETMADQEHLGGLAGEQSQRRDIAHGVAGQERSECLTQ